LPTRPIASISAQISQRGQVPRYGSWRWIICALLFFAATFNYIDRQVIAILKPTLQQDLHWTELDYAHIILSFQLAYAISYLVMGRVIDWLGTRKGFTLAVLIWGIAEMSHSAARSVLNFGEARFALGLGEGGNFPAAIKTVAEWFPQKERALATGIFNAGTNIGAVVPPIIVPLIALHYGWRWTFILTGLLDLLWIVPWLLLYWPPEKHPYVSRAELDYIRSNAPDVSAKIPWRKLLVHRQLWAVAAGKFMTDPVWWLYLFWVPDFLHKTHGITLLTIGVPLVTIYLAADIGSVGGGWLSSSLIRRGWTVNASRKTAMLVCASCAVPMLFAAHASRLWVAVALLCLATAAHQGWSANLFTLSSDMFPRNAVASVIGIVGTIGAIGGMLIAEAVGFVLQRTGSYTLIFAFAACAYLVALGLIHLIVPRLTPVRIEGAEA
jgi:MFS transporter, ACS family, hexuronate transporter